MMKKILLILITIPLIGFSQSSEDAMTKLKNVKELLDLGLLSQAEYDSVSIELKEFILNSKVNSSNADEEYDILQDGFYYKGDLMYPEKFSESKTDVLGYALTYGLAGGSTKSYLNGVTSRVRVDSMQEFNLLITNNVDVAGNSRSNIAYQQYFSSVQSPQDFALVKLSIDKNTEQRWIKTGSMSLADGYNLSIKAKEYIKFEWTKTSNPNEFSINASLSTGEYAFIFIGTSSYSNNSIYTFSVETSKEKESVTTVKKPRRIDFKSTMEYQKALREYSKIK
jgi:hypothetical protein